MNILNVNSFNIKGQIWPGKYLQEPIWLGCISKGADLTSILFPGADLVKGRIVYDSSKLQHGFINSYIAVFLAILRSPLSLSSCSYSTRHNHPDRQYLTVPPFHSSLYKSVKHFGHSFAFNAPNIWNDLPNNLCSATSIASFWKKLKTYLLAKA